MERLEEAPRAAPACPHFGSCGGCAVQHLVSADYATWKLAGLRTALRQQRLQAEIEPALQVPPRTRRRAGFAARRERGSVMLGFHQGDSHRLVQIEDCAVLLPALQNLLPPLRAVLVGAMREGETIALTATATTSGLDLLIGAEREPDLAARETLGRFAEEQDIARLLWSAGAGLPEPIALRREPVVVFSGVRVALPPASFLQPSVEGEAALVGAVRSRLSSARRIADLYAGSGTFTFALAGQASVHAVEGEVAALDALSTAARRAGLAGRITTERRDLAREPLRPAELAGFDAVVFDPPRAGASAQAQALALSAVPRVVAVSCNPATFARDARILVDGGYRLEAITPVDQFPWSAHLEVVAGFSG